MNRNAGYLLVLLLGLVIGYFAGREHLKYEMRSALLSAAEGVSESLSSTFGGGGSNDRRDRSEEAVQAEEDKENAIRTAYIDEHLELYDVSAKYMESMLDGKVPGVLFKLRNSGERSLDKVEVTIYFKDSNGNVIAEEDFLPVLVSKYSFSADSKPLKPGYIWEMERGKFYAAKKVPTEWLEGSVEASITDIRFTE